MLMLSPTMVMDTEAMVDTMVVDTTGERGLLMLMLMLSPTMVMDTEAMVDTDTEVTTEERDLPMLSLTMDTEVMEDTEDTDTEDTTMVKLLHNELFVRVLDFNRPFCKMFQ